MALVVPGSQQQCELPLTSQMKRGDLCCWRELTPQTLQEERGTWKACTQNCWFSDSTVEAINQIHQCLGSTRNSALLNSHRSTETGEATTNNCARSQREVYFTPTAATPGAVEIVGHRLQTCTVHRCAVLGIYSPRFNYQRWRTKVTFCTRKWFEWCRSAGVSSIKISKHIKRCN